MKSNRSARSRCSLRIFWTEALQWYLVPVLQCGSTCTGQLQLWHPRCSKIATMSKWGLRLLVALRNARTIIMSTRAMRKKKKTLFPHLPTTKHLHWTGFASYWILSQVSHSFCWVKTGFPSKSVAVRTCVYYVCRKPRGTSPINRLTNFDVLPHPTSLRCSSPLCPLWCCLARNEKMH